MVKVLDFGIAKVLSEASKALTDAVGTPFWMAPEQSRSSKAIGPHTDIWALGLIVFHMLTGRSYWRAAQRETTNLPEALDEILNQPLVAASARTAELGGPRLPPSFDAWFARCVARDPSARFQTVNAAKDDLMALLASAPEGSGPHSAAASVRAPTWAAETEAALSVADPAAPPARPPRPQPPTLVPATQNVIHEAPPGLQQASGVPTPPPATRRALHEPRPVRKSRARPPPPRDASQDVMWHREQLEGNDAKTQPSARARSARVLLILLVGAGTVVLLVTVTLVYIAVTAAHATAPALPSGAPVPAGPARSSGVPSGPTRPPSAAPTTPTPETTPLEANCNPPYTTNEQGIKVPKPECF